MKLLIIGATSFIGPLVLEKVLLKFPGQEAAVSCLVRSSTDIEKLTKLKNIFQAHARKSNFITGDLSDGESIINCLSEIDCLVYLVDLKNTTFIRNLISAIPKTGIKRAVFVSSTSVLVPFENETKKAKIDSENLIMEFGRQSGFGYTILRPTMIYGSEDDRNYSKMLSFIKRRGFFVMFGSGENLIQPVYIEDIASAVTATIDNNRTFGQTYTLCGKEPIKYKDMLYVVKSFTKKPFKVIRLPLLASKSLVAVYSRVFPKSNLRPDMIERMQVDKAYSYEAAKTDFAFSPIGFRQGIETLIKKWIYNLI